MAIHPGGAVRGLPQSASLLRNDSIGDWLLLASHLAGKCHAPEMKLTPATLRRMEKSARRAAARAYCPYSKFHVGAAVVTASGKIFSGCNVENASYGLCNCAERTAIFSAVADGENTIEGIVIYTATDTPTAPCGACRQVLNEFGPDAFVISVCDNEQRIETSLAELLPAAFGPAALSRKNI